MIDILRWVLFLLFLFIVATCFADEPTVSHTNAEGKITLTIKPCKLGPWFEKWRAASWFYQGKPYEACWTAQGETVILIDSTGIVSAVRAALFKKENPI